MERWNSEGIPREDLRFALKDRRQVLLARRIDQCLLCRRPRVNEAGLCGACWAVLPEDDLRLAQRWLSGEGP
ncbi:MAG TPA: hypothetical protein VM328_02155 [Fimbriimonadaceae bacterium]|nr:hypothetical protein [Fimbriimonadaceae bacterium]